jgi:pimeloyl-ACP methyl ester carboxylesterase
MQTSNVKQSSLFPFILLLVLAAWFSTKSIADVSGVSYRTVEVEGLEIFYREAGNPQRPTIVLLHGFPTSSHMFRDLITELSDEFHLVAPDYPGYGYSSMPGVSEFEYSFDNIARLIGKFIDEIGIVDYSLYLMDYGAPIGYRLATAQPERIQSLIVQNGNAYMEGIDNDFWEPIRAYWKDRDAVNAGLDNKWWKNVKAAYQQPEMTNDQALRFLLTLDATKWQYTNGVKNVESVSPDTWAHVQPLLTVRVTRRFNYRCFTATDPIRHCTPPGNSIFAITNHLR